VAKEFAATIQNFFDFIQFLQSFDATFDATFDAWLM